MTAGGRGNGALPADAGESGIAESAYARLASESYEFITRSMAMRRALKQVYESLPTSSPAARTSEGFDRAWRTSFDQVYDNLFAMFLRPVRLAGSPVDMLVRPLDQPATSPGDMYAGWLKLTWEAQSRGMRAVADALRGTFAEKATTAGDEDLTGRSRQPSPMNLWKNLIDEGLLAYVETLDRATSYFAENQFILPKPIFVAMHRALAGYPRVQRAAREYETLFHDTWEKALGRLSAEVARRPEGYEFNDFFKTYISVFNAEFDKLFRSAGFVKAQNSFVNSVSDLTAAVRQVMQAQMDLFPFLPFASRQDTDAIAQRVHSYKARGDALERKVRRLEAQMNELATMRQAREPATAREPGLLPVPRVARLHSRKAVVRPRPRAAGKVLVA